MERHGNAWDVPSHDLRVPIAAFTNGLPQDVVPQSTAVTTAVASVRVRRGHGHLWHWRHGLHAWHLRMAVSCGSSLKEITS